jgi:predicted HTH transcriptional regulator
MPRNRELMRVFRDVGLVEQLGSGMGRILNAYDKSVFKFTGEFLIVTFPFAEGFNAAINDTDVVNVVNDVANKILDVFKNNPRVTIKEVAKIVEVTSRTIDREVESLKAESKLKRVGSTRSGHWEVL